MKAAEARLRVMFDGEKQYLIPLFQRPYSWEAAEWEQWWSDIVETYEHDEASPHFIGAIVTKALQHRVEGVSRYLVIDGQQRLTTTALLLSAVRDAAMTGSEDLAKRIQGLYLMNRFATGDDSHKLVPTQVDRSEYFSIETGPSAATTKTNITRAYEFFRKRIAEPTESGTTLDLPKIERTLMDRLETVSVNLEEADDEYRIFESLNATGKKLTQADLIRNYVFMRVPVDQEDQLYSRLWLPLQQNLGEHLDDFFRHVLESDGRFVKQDEVYAGWKRRFYAVDERGLISEMDRLATFGAYYKRLVDPDSEPHAGIRDGLKRLNQWGRLTVYPFLLRVYDAHAKSQLSSDDFVQVLLLIESFFVRRMFCGVPTNELNRLFTGLFAQLPTEVGLLAGLTAVLSEPGKRWPKDAALQEAILRYNLYTDSRPDQRRLVLDRLEEALEGKERVDLSGLTIEHVMPQTLSPEWLAALGDTAEETHGKLLHVLGNLTLTGYNPELSNDPFAKKRVLLEESPLAMNRAIATKTRWGAEEILERGRRLSALAVSVWPGPASIVGDGSVLQGVKLLDESPQSPEEEEERAAPVVNREWWEKASSKESMHVVDSLSKMLAEIDDRIQLYYTQGYIRPQVAPGVRLPLWINPKKKFVGVSLHLVDPQKGVDWKAKLDEAGLEAGSKRPGALWFKLMPETLERSAGVVKEILKEATKGD